MPSVFLDANIFFAAVRSARGGSYFVIELAKSNQINVVTTAYALAEAERNIAEKMGILALERHHEHMLFSQLVIQPLIHIPAFERKLSEYLPEKDIPILLGAVLSKVDVLVTLDRKHFLGNKELLKLNLPFLIMTPGDFIRHYIIAE